MKTFAILIDAGFAKRKIKARLKRDVTRQDFENLIQAIKADPYLQNSELYRVFYYDAPPADGKISNPIDGTVTDLSQSPTAIKNKALLDSLRTAPFFALRMGEVSLNAYSWKIKQQKNLRPANGVTAVNLQPSQLTPNITQKGVDMKIGLDMATLALKKQVSIIVLVTSDSDFVPAAKLARTEGVQIYLVNMGHRSLPKLLEHVDVVLDRI